MNLVNIASFDIGRPLLTGVLVALSIYLLLALLIYLFQPRLVYIPHRDLVATPTEIGLAYQEVYFTTEDGVRLSGWLVPAKGARSTVLFCHGNAGNISYLLEELRLFHRLGLNILVFDYRGYGHSEGNPSEQGTYLDVEAAWNFLVREQGSATDEIIVCGHSLGGPIAAWLARKHTPGALFLEAAFTSIPELGQELYPIFPARLLARFAYNTLVYVAEVNCPVLVVHSRDDELIPFTHGRRLFEAARQPKSFVEIRGGHNDGFAISEKIYRKGVEDFISIWLESNKYQK